MKIEVIPQIYFSDVNLVKNLGSSLQEYDALVIVATQFDDLTDFIDSSVKQVLQSFAQVGKKEK